MLAGKKMIRTFAAMKSMLGREIGRKYSAKAIH